MRDTAIESPCIRLCQISATHGICEGCGRTLAEIGGWVELVKGRGSVWNPDSPSLRVRIRDRAGLRLGLQAFLIPSANPNDDSLSVWLEWLDAPDTVPAGSQWNLTFDLTATPPR